MPVISSAVLPNPLIPRGTAANFTPSSHAVNATESALRVVCAWPVSGQYGPGTRVLYYVLVAACVLARKEEWLRNACLAAALLFPAVAAIHGIVLAAVHVDGAVDMDVYGAFQLCSIGILAAPVTVRLSRTYFYDPGRNTIFLWTGLILAGLLSLTVEFYRSTTRPCHDGTGNPISLSPGDFQYGNLCGLTCSPDEGPISPMRRGSANNIFVIPAPDKLNFNTATLLAAACCIPAILSLISMWNRIIEINWKKHSRDEEDEERIDQVIEGTNGATERSMAGINNVIRTVLSGVEIPIFSAAVLALLIIGERNFFSPQVRYQTEPMASIGQWSPVAGTVFAAVGSLYMLLTVKKPPTPNPSDGHHCNCSHHNDGNEPMPSFDQSPALRLTPSRDHSPGSGGTRSIEAGTAKQLKRTTTDAGNRRKVANIFTSISNYFSTAAHDDVSDFKRGPAVDFPELPGEIHRNRQLPQIRETYNQPRDADGNLTPSLRKSNSRGSFNGSMASGLGIEGVSTHGTSLELQNTATVSTTAGSPGYTRTKRRDTLEVPPQAYHSPARIEPSSSSTTSVVG